LSWLLDSVGAGSGLPQEAPVPSGHAPNPEDPLLNEDNLREGYIRLYRSLQDNILWRRDKKRELSELEAWIDILLQVRWKDSRQQVAIGRHVLYCDRGESLNSLDTWAKRWNWKSKFRVRSYLTFLERLGQIQLFNERVTIRLFVVHYKEYQDYKNANPNEPSTEPQQSLNKPSTEPQSKEEWKECNNVKKDSLSYVAPEPATTKARAKVIRHSKPEELTQISEFAYTRARKFIENQKAVRPNISLDLEEQARHVQNLLDADPPYSEKTILEVLQFITQHREGEFSWFDQVQSLHKLVIKPKKNSPYHDGYYNWMDVFIDLRRGKSE